MFEFATIRNISDILPAIQGRDEFVVAEKGSYTAINYNVMFQDTFLDPYEDNISSNEKTTRQLRRECRGIIFDSETGDIIRRPFHKFKNVNEAPETQADCIDLSQPHVILEKLDGSMIAPFRVGDGNNGITIWGTKMGATDVAAPVEEFVKQNPIYEDFALGCISSGLTPIFEWCSRKQRIVLDYAEDQLILTGIRKMESGVYWTYQEMNSYASFYNIPVVRAFEPQVDMKSFLEYVHDLKDIEGFVVRFENGQMFKLKCHWYIQLHKAKEAILQDRNIVELILENHLDDIKAHLPSEDRERISLFEAEFNLYTIAQARYIEHILDNILVDNIDRKTFALEMSQDIDPFSRAIVFKNFEGGSLEKLENEVRNTIRNNLGRTSKYEAVRDVWFAGLRYN